MVQRLITKMRPFWQAWLPLATIDLRMARAARALAR